MRKTLTTITLIGMMALGNLMVGPAHAASSPTGIPHACASASSFSDALICAKATAPLNAQIQRKNAAIARKNARIAHKDAQIAHLRDLLAKRG